MKFIKSLLVASVLTFAAVTTQAATDYTDSTYISIDAHDTTVIVMSEELVKAIWDDVVNEEGLSYTLRVEDGIGVKGLEATYRDSKGYVRSAYISDTDGQQDELPANWNCIMYYGDDEVEGSVAFIRSPDTGEIFFYLPGAAKF